MSVWLSKEADAKMGLNVQEIYWGKYLCKIKGKGVKYSGETSSTAGVIPMKEDQEVLVLIMWYEPNLHT